MTPNEASALISASLARQVDNAIMNAIRKRLNAEVWNLAGLQGRLTAYQFADYTELHLDEKPLLFLGPPTLRVDDRQEFGGTHLIVTQTMIER